MIIFIVAVRSQSSIPLTIHFEITFNHKIECWKRISKFYIIEAFFLLFSLFWPPRTYSAALTF